MRVLHCSRNANTLKKRAYFIWSWRHLNVDFSQIWLLMARLRYHHIVLVQVWDWYVQYWLRSRYDKMGQKFNETICPTWG